MSQNNLNANQNLPTEKQAANREPVVYWAFIGAIISSFWLWIIVKWITGPYFTPTITGPTEQPDWLGPAQIAFQVVMILSLVVVGYKLLIKPWREEKKLTLDGALFIAFFTMILQDQITFMGGGYWFTYNAHVFNMGSWFPEIPGWLAFAEPGKTAGEPIFMMGPGYAYFFLVMTFLGMFVMRKGRELMPTASVPVLFFCVFLATGLADMVIELGFWIPLGFYSYTFGGFLPMINAGSIQQFPLIEAVGVGVLSTAIVALRYYTNDKGETVVERGIDNISAAPLKIALMRLFALIGAIQLIYFFSYSVPMYNLGSWSRDWPEAIQERSYLMNGICGTDTPRACRTSDAPIIVRSDNAISVSPQGELYVPDGAVLNKEQVPFISKPRAGEGGWIVTPPNK